MILRRTSGPDWEFTYSELDGEWMWLYRTKKNVYRVFIEEGKYPDVWVGRMFNEKGRRIWFTIEARLGAFELQFGRGTFVLNRNYRLPSGWR